MLLSILVCIDSAFIGTALARARGIFTATSGVDWLEGLTQTVVAAVGVALVSGLMGRKNHSFTVVGAPASLGDGLPEEPG
jgi:hypothetical protein